MDGTQKYQINYGLSIKKCECFAKSYWDILGVQTVAGNMRTGSSQYFMPPVTPDNAMKNALLIVF